MSKPHILLMRHAEKSGDPLDPHLSPDGAARAIKLAGYLPTVFGTPDFLLATAISKNSKRPVETITPLANKIGLPIDDQFADQDYGALAAMILSEPSYSGKLVVVCWHHGNIPSLARALGAAAGSYPDPWPPDVFNLILDISYSDSDVSDIKAIVEPF